MNLLLLSSSVKELRKIKHLVYFLPQIERHNPFSVGKNLTEVKAEQSNTGYLISSASRDGLEGDFFFLQLP